MNCKILKSGKCKITQKYSLSHPAIDIVGENNTLDYVTAHSNGTIIEIQDGQNNGKGTTGKKAYGNYIKIQHNNKYMTLYAHLEKGIKLRKNQLVSAGQQIGYMSDSGNAYGKHLHFEVFKNNKKINPTEFLNKNFSEINLNYQIGTKVTIKNVYKSSTSNKALTPLINEGTITKIIPNARNPYLLNNGQIGWINDESVIIKNNQYLSNKSYQGTSIVDALKEIDIDSSFNNRKKIAKKNNINNYQGAAEQNIKLLQLLKIGKLKY